MIELPKLDRGMVIADRYVVSEIVRPWLAEHPAVGSVCLGLDAILDSPVILYVADAQESGDLLDAGRRASLLTDPRIPAVLDVGTSQGFDFVVCERIGGTPLPQALKYAPLTPAAAQAVAGEVSTALAHAAKRGLHHLFLGPESVVITDDNEIVVHGLAIDAAVADGPYEMNLGAMTAAQAQRTDALAVINILYACLTAHWPGTEERADLPPAGKKNNRIVPVHTFTAAVPTELEQFVSGVVAETEPGPRSPSEIVRYLDDWDASALNGIDRNASERKEDLFTGHSAMTTQSARPSTHVVAPAQHGAGATGKPEVSQSGRSATPAQLQAALTRIGMTRPGVHGAAAGVSGTTHNPFDDRMKMRRASRFPIAPTSLEAEQTEEWQPEDTLDSYSDYAQREVDENMTQPILNRDLLWSDANTGADTQALDIVDPQAAGVSEEPRTDQRRAAETSRATADSQAGSDGDDESAWFMGGMFETREQQYAQQQQEFEHERRLREEALERTQTQERAAAHTREEQSEQAERARRRSALSAEERRDPAFSDTPARTPWPAGAAGASAAAAAGTGAAAPGAAEGSPTEPRSDGTATGASAADRFALADSEPDGKRRRRGLPIALGAFAVLAVLGLIAFFLVKPGGDHTAAPGPGGSSAAPSPQDQTPRGPAPAIDSIKPIDPQGNGTEHNEQAKSLTKKSGTWSTDRYNSASFGGLKDGLGLRIKLKKKAAVSSTTVDSTVSGGKFEVQVGDSTKRSAAQKVGSGTFSKGKTEVSFDKPVEGSYVYIWITKLPNASDGYKAQLKRVEVG